MFWDNDRKNFKILVKIYIGGVIILPCVGVEFLGRIGHFMRF